MREITYRLQPEHLGAYQKLAAARMSAPRSSGDTWIFWLLFTFAGAGLLAIAALVRSTLTGRPPAALELVLGFACGVALTIAAIWRQSVRAGRRSLRPDGPTLSVRTCAVTPEGLRSEGPLGDAFYRWSAFQAVSVADTVIVLWMEPASGLPIPRDAFAAPADEAGFLDAVRRYMQAAATAPHQEPLFTPR